MAWQPPKRPTDLRDHHVVDVFSDQLKDIDYFTLILEKRSEPRKSAPATPVLTSKSSQSLNEGIVVEEESNLMDWIVLYKRKIIFTLLLIAGAFGLYSFIQYLLAPKGRIPATSQTRMDDRKTIKPLSREAPPKQPLGLESQDTLGSGRNIIRRNVGGVNTSFLAKPPVPQEPEPTPTKNVTAPIVASPEPTNLQEVQPTTNPPATANNDTETAPPPPVANENNLEHQTAIKGNNSSR